MFTRQTTFNRRLTGPVCAVALAVLLAGNVAAAQLASDAGGQSALVTPKAGTRISSSQLFKLKVATYAGRFVLERG
jgi:hypothetical protein